MRALLWAVLALYLLVERTDFFGFVSVKHAFSRGFSATWLIGRTDAVKLNLCSRICRCPTYRVPGLSVFDSHNEPFSLCLSSAR